MGLLLMLLPPLGAQAVTVDLVPGEMQACQLNDGVSTREVDKVMTKIADWLEADGHEYDLWMRRRILGRLKIMTLMCFF